MNAVRLVLLVALSSSLLACGDGASTDPFIEDLIRSGEGLSDLLDETAECWGAAGPETSTCDCSGGGILRATRVEQSPRTQVTRLVLGADCQDENGLGYEGVQIISEVCEDGTFPDGCLLVEGDEGNFEMSTFGVCRNTVSTSDPAVECSGVLAGTCAGARKTCEAFPVGDDCSFSCS